MARIEKTQVITTGAASAAMAAPLSSETYSIRLSCTVACHYAIGTAAVVATINDTLLPPNWVEYITVSPGQQVAAIQDAAAGKLYVTELS